MINQRIPWPGGARAAAAITFDVDVDSILHLEFGADAHRRAGLQSWFRYDEVAVPAILDLYRRLELRQTFFMPGWCVERYPRLAEQIVAEGHELAAHGYMHELAHTLEPDAEQELMGRAIQAVLDATGVAPRGWRGPLYSFSDRTASLLAKSGLSYDSSLMADHRPYRLETQEGGLWELPVEWANDDWPQYVTAPDFDWVLGVRAPDRAFESFTAEFESAYRAGLLWIGVWHPFVSGRPARLERIERFILDLRERGDVWLARLDEVSDHLTALERDGAWSGNRVEMPYDAAPD
jgi:peptidoglycan/xylan/chitin deacetylase (PgdA/CDA1 family)